MQKRLFAVLAALCMVMAACGDDDGDDAAGAGETTTSAVQQDETSSTTAQQEETSSTAAPADDSQADPDGVVRLAYDLAAASRGGFSFDPSAATQVTSDLAVQQWVYGALMRLTPEGTLEPDLAESATVVDPNTIEVVMREGVTLSDGTPVDAEMVKAVLDRNISTPGLPAFQPQFYSLQSADVTAPNTVTLHIPDGTAAGWYDLFLSGPETLIVPDGTDFNDPAGAGPFTVAEYAPSQRLVLEKNPQYWDADRIKAAGIELIHTPPDNAQAGVSALLAGQVDWTRLDISLLDAAGSDVELDLAGDPEMLTQFLICKTTAPLDDVRVRQALNLAVDRDAINEALFNGAGEPAWDLWPEGHRLHNEELTGHYAYDPEGAKELLAEAGVADGLAVDIIPIAGANVPEIVQIVQQQWAAVGVTLNIVSSAAFVDDFLITNKAPLGAVPRSASGRGKLTNYNGDAVGNVCDYNDPELAALIDELATVSDNSEEGVQLWAEIQDVVVNDALSIFVAFQPRVYAFEGDRLGDYALVPYAISVPDMWDVFVKA